MGAVASLFLKKATSSIRFSALFFNYKLYLGGILYLISAILNIIVLRSLDYSIVVPLTSLTYVWTMLLSRYFLNEEISRKKVIGIICIIIGIVFISCLPRY